MKALVIRLLILFLLAIAVGMLVFTASNQRASVSHTQGSNGVRTVTSISDPFLIDRMYSSMQGPWKVNPIVLDPEGPKRLAWIRGIDFLATDTDGNPLPDQKNLCHGQVRYENPKLYASKNVEIWDNERTLPAKWFTVIQGQSGIHFPEGFGIPMLSNEPLEAMTMAINQVEDFKPFVLKMNTNVHYVYDDEVPEAMIPLGKFVADIRVPVSKAAKAMKSHDHGDDYSTTCAIDEYDNVVFAEPAKKARITKRDGQDVAFHFMVPPGRHTYRYQFPGSHYIPFATTLHHITGHLHVYGETVSISDVTTGQELYTVHATANEEMEYITKMTEYVSREGLPMHPDHLYEMKAVYNNTTDEPVDAMAVMYFYFRDRAFEKRALVGISQL